MEINNVAFTKLSDRPFHSLWFMIRHIPDLLRLKSYESVWKMVSRHLADDRLRQAFSVQPLLVGGNPYATSFTTCSAGAFFVTGFVVISTSMGVVAKPCLPRIHIANPYG